MTPRLKTTYDKTIVTNLMSKLNYKNKHKKLYKNQSIRTIVKKTSFWKLYKHTFHSIYYISMDQEKR